MVLVGVSREALEPTGDDFVLAGQLDGLWPGHPLSSGSRPNGRQELVTVILARATAKCSAFHQASSERCHQPMCMHS